MTDLQQTVTAEYNCDECGQFTPEMDFTEFEIVEGDARISCPNCGGGYRFIELVSYMPS